MYNITKITITIIIAISFSLIVFGGRGRILTYESSGLQSVPLNTLVPDHYEFVKVVTPSL